MPCYEKHPRLKLGGGTFVGGSCSRPVEKEARAYIGFESSMPVTIRSYPWHPQVDELLFPITDRTPPKESTYGEFVKLVEWTSELLAEGHTVHAGCIGGHGRTGTFLAALVTHIQLTEGEEGGWPPTGEFDAIAWVRKNYCERAVESKGQIDYLMKEWGCKTAKPSKGGQASTIYTSPGKATTTMKNLEAKVPTETSGDPVWTESQVWGNEVIRGG